MFCKISEKNSVKNKKNKNYLQQKRKKGKKELSGD